MSRQGTEALSDKGTTLMAIFRGLFNTRGKLNMLTLLVIAEENFLWILICCRCLDRDIAGRLWIVCAFDLASRKNYLCKGERETKQQTKTKLCTCTLNNVPKHTHTGASAQWPLY